MRETWVRSLGWEDPLEEGMATHSSIPAWRIPWTEESGGLQAMGSQTDTHEAIQHARMHFQSPQWMVNGHLLSYTPQGGAERCSAEEKRIL